MKRKELVTHRFASRWVLTHLVIVREPPGCKAIVDHRDRIPSYVAHALLVCEMHMLHHEQTKTVALSLLGHPTAMQQPCSSM